MDDISTYLLVVAIVLIVWAVILSNIISSATDSKKKNKLLEAQVKLLIELAIKQGVDNSRITEIANGL